MTVRFIVKHVKSGLYLSGPTHFRWVTRDEALAMTMDDWDLRLTPQSRTLLEFEPARAQSGVVPASRPGLPPSSWTRTG